MEHSTQQLGKDITEILKTMGLFCSLQNTIDNEISTCFEFTLGNLRDFQKLSKAIQVLKICYHKNITMSESEQYHFKIQIPKDKIILNTNDYTNEIEDSLSVLIGLDEYGQRITFDLRKSIHTLIAGATGMGKTNILNNIIYTLAKKNDKSQIKFYLIDIKKTLAVWNNLPQLALETAQSPTDALELLGEISYIIEDRFEKLAKHKKLKADKDTFPQIVVVIDELADLMLSGLRDYIEEKIIHIAQIGRAVNVSLLIATQSPIAKVCTNLIKANCPTIIALKTVSIPTSRVILDNKHAFELQGVGDCIIRNADYPCEKKFKALYLDENEIIKYVKEARKCLRNGKNSKKNIIV